MLDTRQIHSLTDFLRNHKAHVARLKETKAPEILTVNGRAEIVIQDAESYQDLLDRWFCRKVAFSRDWESVSH